MKAKVAAAVIISALLVALAGCVPIPPAPRDPVITPAQGEIVAGLARGGIDPTNTPTATPTRTATATPTATPPPVYKIDVSKDAATALLRTYRWKIQKSSVPDKLTLSPGQSALVEYAVDVSEDGEPVDGNWMVRGKITVSNGSSVAAPLVAVLDITEPDIEGTVDCGVSFPYSLPPGQSLACSYRADLPDAADRINRAMATLGMAEDVDMRSTSQQPRRSDFAATAQVSFAGAVIDRVDECVNVTDSLAGALGTVCAGVNPLAGTFRYSRTIGPFAECGKRDVTNTASFVTIDTRATGSVVHTIAVDVPCEGGCTLTQGYWKTHSNKGPAKYDDAWSMIGSNAEDTPFFGSGQTYYQVLWTEPEGNAYYILAHQYIAAKLNLLNGAGTTTEVNGAVAWAEGFFTTTPSTPAPVDPLRAQALSNAELLDDYNNGRIGPGHCSE